MSTLSDKLKEMRQRCEAASGKTWNYGRDYNTRIMYIEREDHSRVYVCGGDGPWLCMSEADAKFTASARTEMPALIEALTVAVDALEYIIEHEKYHGVNQGRDSEVIAEEALAAIERALG